MIVVMMMMMTIVMMTMVMMMMMTMVMMTTIAHSVAFQIANHDELLQGKPSSGFFDVDLTKFHGKTFSSLMMIMMMMW